MLKQCFSLKLLGAWQIILNSYGRKRYSVVRIWNQNKVSFLNESLAQSIIFNTTILVKCWWVDMFSVLIALKVWTYNGWFYTCTTHVRCTGIIWVEEADGATNNYRGNTFPYWHQNILPLLSYGSSFCHFMYESNMLFYALTLARRRGMCWKMIIAYTNLTFCDGRRMKTIKLHSNSTSRSRHQMGKEHIQFRRHKIRTARAGSQEEMATGLS